MGTADEALNYVQMEPGLKEDGSQVIYTFKYGTISNPKPGKRSDLALIKEKLDRAEPMTDIADQHFSQWVRYHKSFEKYATLIQPDRAEKTQVVLITGPSGSGKTRCAHRMDGSAWWADANFEGKWFDGYHGQETVVFDDIKQHLPYRLFLRLMDRYPCDVPVKGGFVKWRPTLMIITSSMHPNQWFPNEIDMTEFFRRVHQVIEANPNKEELGESGLKGTLYEEDYAGYKLNF